MPDRLTTRIRPADSEPQGALVLFHGRGADQNDLAGLADVFDPQRRLVVVFPRGPLSLPPGGAHWYALGGIPTPDPGTFWPTFELVGGWLDAVLEAQGVTIERTVLGGFSQGAVMSWALGTAEGRPTPAGIMALSGFMPEVEGLTLDLARPGLSVAIGHGEHDPVIGVEWGRDARDRATAAGAEVLYRETPLMGHSIDPGFIPDLTAWLTTRLP